MTTWLNIGSWLVSITDALMKWKKGAVNIQNTRNILVILIVVTKIDEMRIGDGKNMWPLENSLSSI